MADANWMKKQVEEAQRAVASWPLWMTAMGVRADVCVPCKGDGDVYERHGQDTYALKCPACNGTGRAPEKETDHG